MKSLLLLSTFLLSAPTYAAECRSLGWFKRYVMPNLPEGSSIAVVNKYSLADVLQRFNLMPPVSTFEADDIEVLTMPDSDIKVVMLYNNGCGVVFQRLPPDLFETLMGVAS